MASPCSIDWGATAAWAQAFLSAGAVFAAWKLQDLSLARRDASIQNRRLNGAAAVARYAYETIVEITAKLRDGSDPAAVLDAYELGQLIPPQQAIKSVSVVELEDDLVLRAFIDLDIAYTAAEGRLRALVNLAAGQRGSGMAVNALSFMGDRVTVLNNAAASIERRVAKIVGRQQLM